MTVDTAGVTTFTRQAVPNMQTSSAVATFNWDVNLGNVMNWSAGATAATTVNMYNVKAGGQYMLSVQGTRTGAITVLCYAGSGTGVLPATSYIPANGLRVAGTLNKTVYSIISDGTNCMATWITGF